jgi:hypothetical protein
MTSLLLRLFSSPDTVHRGGSGSERIRSSCEHHEASPEDGVRSPLGLPLLAGILDNKPRKGV